MYTYIYIYIHICLHTHIYVYVSKCECNCICIHTYIYIYLSQKFTKHTWCEQVDRNINIPPPPKPRSSRSIHDVNKLTGTLTSPPPQTLKKSGFVTSCLGTAVGLKKGHAYAQIEKKSLIIATAHIHFFRGNHQLTDRTSSPDHLAEEGIETWIAHECRYMQMPCLLMQGICTLQLPTCEGALGCEQVSSPKVTIGRMFEWCLSAVVKPSLKPMSLGTLERYVGAGQVVATLRAERSHPGGWLQHIFQQKACVSIWCRVS